MKTNTETPVTIMKTFQREISVIFSVIAALRVVATSGTHMLVSFSELMSFPTLSISFC